MERLESAKSVIRTTDLDESSADGSPVPPSEPVREETEMEFPTTVEKTKEESDSKTFEQDNKVITEKRYELETREFVDPRNYGLEVEEDVFKYVPPERDEHLPDLDRMMATLDTGSGDLEIGAEPPSLFTQPEHVTSYRKITELKMEIEEDKLPPYVENFEEGIKDDVLMIGQIGLEDVQEEEKRLRDEHIAYQEQEAKTQRDRRQELLITEDAARKRIAFDLKEKRRDIRRRELLQHQRERLVLDSLHKSFRRSENQLVSTLEKRKAEIKTYYGDLTSTEGHYGGSQGRRWKVDWDKTPQPIQVKLKTLRGVKDKLPGGRYVIMVSLYNRVGGHVMRWTNLKGQQWGGASLPIIHDGQFYNAEMKVDQSVFTVLPSKPGIRPGMVLVFELFLLRGAVVQTDRVVGWGCFPIADGKFDVVEGKYKCPLLRGEIDAQLDKHDKLEALMASDLDHWLCNLYFEVVRLPRYLAGQKEYEVELQFSSGMLAHPDRINTAGEEYKDGEAPVPGSSDDIKSNDLSATTSADDQTDLNLALSSEEVSKEKDNLSLTSEKYTKPGAAERPTTTYGSRAYRREKDVKLDEESDTDYDEDDVYLMKKDDDFYPVKGENGLYYRKHLNNPVDKYHKKLYSLLPKTPLLNQRRKKKKLTYLEQLEEHTFSVKRPFSDLGHPPNKGWEKFNYVRRQFMAELGLSQWRSREFWGMLVMFILVFFIRIYLHYIGQWILLQAIEVPTNKFNFLPYTVEVNYQNTLLRARQEIGMVMIGPLTVIATFLLFVLVSWVCQRFLGHFPDIGSKFVVSFGIQGFLDPVLILIVDCILQRYLDITGTDPIADFAKLYWHFFRAQGSGLAGILITVFLYIFTTFLAGASLYMYFLRLHNNGRMLDIYWRLHGEEDVFFTPYDLEVSNHELSYILKKADQWRGEEGERRKVAVYDYVWEEENVEEVVWDENGDERRHISDGKKEVTTHVSVHTLHLDGLKEMYRHFLRLPDGGVVEVFGDMSVAGMDKDITKAVTEGSKQLADVAGDGVAKKRSGRETAFTNAGFALENEESRASSPSFSKKAL